VSEIGAGLPLPVNRQSNRRDSVVCGRYVVKSPSANLKVKFHLDEVPLFEPRYNVAPTQLVGSAATIRSALRPER
jgi:hypothetical protein